MMKKEKSENKISVYISSPKKFYPEGHLMGVIFYLLVFLALLFIIIKSPNILFKILIANIYLFLSIYLIYFLMHMYIIKLNKKKKQLIIQNYFASKLNLKSCLKIIHLQKIIKNNQRLIQIYTYGHDYSSLKPIMEYLKKYFRGKVTIKCIPERLWI